MNSEDVLDCVQKSSEILKEFIEKRPFYEVK
jgi:hypothetical protein